jgi:hypothetical protein
LRVPGIIRSEALVRCKFPYEGLVVAPQKEGDILALDEALTEFGVLYPRQSQVVELRFFGGLEVKEAAEVSRCRRRQSSVTGDSPKPGFCAPWERKRPEKRAERRTMDAERARRLEQLYQSALEHDEIRG